MVYDNINMIPSYLALELPQLLKAHHEPRGAIATKLTKEPTMSSYVVEWKRLGWAKEVETFAKSINLDQIKKTIRRSFISLERQDALTRLIENRNKELADAI